MLSETKQKFFLGALARRNFVAPTRPKNFCLTSHSIRNRHISSAFTFTGNQFLTYILKKMKVFYDRYETLLHIFTSDSVRQVLPKFLPLNCGRKITDSKEWSKTRVAFLKIIMVKSYKTIADIIIHNIPIARTISYRATLN